MLQIVMPRGDRVSKSFIIRGPDKQPFTGTLDEIYFTVKKSFMDRNYKFQKKLSDGSIASVGGGRYQFTILPEDTDGLNFEDYDFDIEVIKYNEIKKTFAGKLILTVESTHRGNEG